MIFHVAKVYDNGDAWSLWRLKSGTARLFLQKLDIKENNKAPNCWSFVRRTHPSPKDSAKKANHDDVIKWNVFRVADPLLGESTGHWWIPLTKASDAELWCFVWYAPVQTVQQTIETPVIWDAISLIMTSQ